MSCRFVAALAVAITLGAGATAKAQVASQTFNLGDLFISGQTPLPLDLTGVTGDFIAYRVTTDWAVSFALDPASDPFSNEASVFFGDADTFTIISDTASPVNGAGTGDPVAGLTLVGGFDSNPVDAVIPEVIFDSGGFGDADFNSTVIEWFTEGDLPTSSVTVGGGPTSVNAPTTFIDLGELGTSADSYVFSTLGSLEAGLEADTELALYSAAGDLIFNNDDAVPGAVFTSEIAIGGAELVIDGAGMLSFASVALAPGDYFLIIDEFDTLFGEDFDVIPGTEAGDLLDIELSLNGVNIASFQLADVGPAALRFTVVPEPTACVLMFAGLAGAIGYRRR